MGIEVLGELLESHEVISDPDAVLASKGVWVIFFGLTLFDAEDHTSEFFGIEVFVELRHPFWEMKDMSHMRPSWKILLVEGEGYHQVTSQKTDLNIQDLVGTLGPPRLRTVNDAPTHFLEGLSKGFPVEHHLDLNIV